MNILRIPERPYPIDYVEIRRQLSKAQAGLKAPTLAAMGTISIALMRPGHCIEPEGDYMSIQICPKAARAVICFRQTHITKSGER